MTKSNPKLNAPPAGDKKKKLSVVPGPIPAPPPIPDRVCLTCAHYLSEGASGYCREGPAQVVAAEMREEMRKVEEGKAHRLVKHLVVTNYTSQFPLMYPIGTCGRHKQRDHK